MGQDGVSTSPPTLPDLSTAQAFWKGLYAAATSVFVYVLVGTFIGYGALSHDLDFSLTWALVSVPLIWAGPAQVILVTTLGSGAPLIQSAIAIGLSGIRLLPMVVTLLPMLKTRRTRVWHLLLPAHFTAVSMWVESLRLAPKVPRERRIAFCNGLGTGMIAFSMAATVLGYFLAARLPTLFAAAVLFLTPLSFLMSTARNARELVDKLALVFGLVLAPLFAMTKFELHLLFAGLAAGTLAYAVNRLREAAR